MNENDRQMKLNPGINLRISLYGLLRARIKEKIV